MHRRQQLPDEIVRCIVAECFFSHVELLNQARIRSTSLLRLTPHLEQLGEWMRLVRGLSIPVDAEVSVILATYRACASLVSSNGIPR